MTAIQKWKLSRLSACAEATFGVDASASGALYKHLMCRGDMTFQPMVDVIERTGLVNDLTRQPHVMGGKRGTLSFKTELKASGTAATNGVAAIAAESDVLLQSLLGTVTRGTGTLAVAAGSTTTVINVTAGQGTQFSVGMLANFVTANGNEKRFITVAAANALTVDRALSAVPTNATSITASNRFTRANTGQGSMSFNAIRDGIEYTFLGGKLACKIAGVTAKSQALLEWTVEVADWSATTKASLPAADPTGITAVRGPAIKGAPFCIAGTEEPLYAFEFDFGQKFEHQESTSGPTAGALAGGDGNISGFALTDAMPGGVIKSYFQTQHLTDFLAGTENSITITCGDTATGWGLYIVKAQYMNPALEDKSGMVGQSIAFKVNDNGSAAEYYLSVF